MKGYFSKGTTILWRFVSIRYEGGRFGAFDIKDDLTKRSGNMKATKENIDDLIDEWHESNSELPLHEYLGLTWEQYKHWIKSDELPNS
jgi:hypothetical protein